MFKNVASQKIAVYAFDATTGTPKTGDAAQLTAYVSKDYGAVTVLGDTSATEMDATNAKGMYLFDVTQTETNADCLIFTAKSSTSNIYIAPQTIYTDPASYTSFVTPTNLTAAQIATGVWQDTTAGDFTTALSVGKSVMNGVALGTGLTVNAVTGLTASNLDATISSRASQTSLDTVDDFLDTEIAAIKTQTDKFVFTTANQVDCQPISIAANAITAAAIAADAIGSSELAATAANEIADAILDRDMSTGADSGSATVRTPRQALRFLRNKWDIAAGTLTVKKEDDATTSWTSAMSTDAAAVPIIGADPAGP